jgi:hypothetical protein
VIRMVCMMSSANGYGPNACDIDPVLVQLIAGELDEIGRAVDQKDVAFEADNNRTSERTRVYEHALAARWSLKSGLADSSLDGMGRKASDSRLHG